jgi:Zn-dependent protease with chaperone function
MSADVARAHVARQQARNRIFVAVAAAAALLDAGIIAVMVAAVTRSVAAVVAALVVIAVIVVISVSDAVRSVGRVQVREPDAAESDRLQPVVARLARRLGIAAPMVCIAADYAVNAFSISSGSSAAVFFTEGFLEEFDDPGDRPLIEAVTAHLLARVAARDNSATVVSDGLLNWALFLFNTVFRGFARLLRFFGRGYLNPDNHHRLKPADHVYGDDAFNRLLVWAISVAIGLCLILASIVAVAAGGILFLVAGGVRLGLTRQRIRIADSIAAELIEDPQALRVVMGRLSDISQQDDERIALDRREQSVHDLCFHRPSRYYPELSARAADVPSPAETRAPGILTPIASGLAVTVLIGGVALLAASVPYGLPFGGSVGVSSPIAQAQPVPGSGASGQVAGTPGTPSPADGTLSPGAGSASGSTPAAQNSTTPPSARQHTSPSRPQQPAPIPATPGTVTATVVDQFTIKVAWADSSTAATGFKIDNGCPVGSCDPGATLARTTGPVTTTNFTVTPGSYQCFRVQAFDSSGASAWSGYGCTSTPGFTLAGAHGWADTGVQVTAGIELGLSASGTMSVDSSRQVSPAGDQSCVPAVAYPAANPAFIAPDLHCWALIARIGDGPPFEIGTAFTSIIGQSGRLYLSVNGDSLATYPGSWTVKIKKGGAA